MSRAHPSGIARAVGWLLVAAGVCVLLGGIAPESRAADPTTPPSPVLIDPLDPRTGEEASAVGAPLLALLIVVGSGLIVALVTFAYVRLASRRQMPR